MTVGCRPPGSALPPGSCCHRGSSAEPRRGRRRRRHGPPVDYGDKLPPSPQYIFTPPRRYIFTPPRRYIFTPPRRYIFTPPLTERINEENLYRVEIYQSFPEISVRDPAFSKSVIKANADFFKFLTIPECPRRRLAIYGRKRRVDAACHPTRHGHRFRRRDPLL